MKDYILILLGGLFGWGLTELSTIANSYRTKKRAMKLLMLEFGNVFDQVDGLIKGNQSVQKTQSFGIIPETPIKNFDLCMQTDLLLSMDSRIRDFVYSIHGLLSHAENLRILAVPLLIPVHTDPSNNNYAQRKLQTFAMVLYECLEAVKGKMTTLKSTLRTL